MSEYDCPVDWCEHSGDLSSVRGHINGSTDPDHDWSELKDQIETQTDQSEGGPSDGDESGDGAVSDPSDDGQPAEGGETSDEGGSERASEGGTMPTDDEYENQTNGDQGEPTDESQTETDGEGGSNPVCRRRCRGRRGHDRLIAGQSMWVVAGIALLALLVVLLVTSDEGEPTAENAMGAEDERGSDDPSEGDSEGGSDRETGGLID